MKRIAELEAEVQRLTLQVAELDFGAGGVLASLRYEREQRTAERLAANKVERELAEERARLTAAIDELEWQVENVGDGALHRHEVRTRLYAAIDAAKEANRA